MEVFSSHERMPKTEEPDLEVKDEIKKESRVAAPPTNNPILTPAIKTKDEDGDSGRVDRSLPEFDPAGDMFQDVDEDEIVDLTYEGIAHVDGIRHFVCDSFKIPQIPDPLIIKRRLVDLYQCIEAKSIYLDPDYQREVVWDEGRAATLINSILMGYFIPPIIFNVKKNVVKVEGKEKISYLRICVDGKQRLTSIWKFMSGKIGFFDASSPAKKWYYCHQIINGQIQISNRNVLPNAVKKFFNERVFCTYEYEGLSQDTEETMFQLVQRGVALTPAEKMRAMSTEWAVFTRQYEEDYELIVNLSKQNRASGFRLILTIFTMIQEVMAGQSRRKKAVQSTTPTLQASPQALNRVLDDKGHINPVLKLKFKAIFDRYEALVKHSSSQVTATRWKVNTNSVFDPAPEFLRKAGVTHVRTFSPLELVVTAILVAVHMDHRTDEQLLEDVLEMRKYLRINHKDLRVNAQCWNTAWNFITTEMSRRREKTEAEAEGPVLPSIEGGPVSRSSRPIVLISQSSSARHGSSSPLSSAPSSSPDRDATISDSPEFTPPRSKAAARKSHLAASNGRPGRKFAGPFKADKANGKRPRSAVQKSRPPKKKSKLSG